MDSIVSNDNISIGIETDPTGPTIPYAWKKNCIALTDNVGWTGLKTNPGPLSSDVDVRQFEPDAEDDDVEFVELKKF